jgi:putative membrane protein
MIRDYRDHAANERTFLAWVRTGIAVIAFGFVIEKFNLFVITMADAGSLNAARRLQLERLSEPLTRYDAFALILLGIALVAVSTTRFIRTERLLDDQESHPIIQIRLGLDLGSWDHLLKANLPGEAIPLGKRLGSPCDRRLVIDSRHRSIPCFPLTMYGNGASGATPASRGVT